MPDEARIPLTPRECDVPSLLARGATYSQVELRLLGQET